MSRISLDGAWKFRHSSDGDGGCEAWRDITVPGPWQAQFDDLRMRSGHGVYRREIDIPKGWLRGSVLLRFGGVFHYAKVFVNGKPVGENAGGFLPFAFDVTSTLREDEPNELVVVVESPTDDDAHADGPLGEHPFGKQSWYGPLSGIWQSAYLERRDRDHMSRVRITPELGTGDVQMEITFAAPLSAPLEVELEVLKPDGTLAAAVIDTLSAGSNSISLKSHLENVLSWSPDAPHLYRAILSLRRNGEVVDQVLEPFGFRTFEARGGRFYLNGDLFYLRGALDQDYYPDGICTPPSQEFLEDQFGKAKELGLNMLRCHIKAPDPRYYEVADRLGMLIWAELPNSALTTKRSRHRAETLLKGIVDRDSNHPCIVAWTVINENWGTDLVHNTEHRGWVRRTYEWLKSYDPGRLVVDNSPLAPSTHVRTDIADFHFYAAIPDSRQSWDRFVDDLASRPSWLFADDGQTLTTGDEPLVCSEFGNWGLPNPDDLRDKNGREPWWFETGHDWGDGVVYAHGAERRFHDWSLDRVFGSLRNFVEEVQWQQFRALKYQIQTMRLKPTIAGYVITELTDCHWESNGLLDMRRNPRVFHDKFSIVNADTVVLPSIGRSSRWSGERARVRVSLARCGGAAVVGASLKVDEDANTIPIKTLASGDVADLGEIEVDIPQVEVARLHHVNFELTAADGLVLASNNLALAIYPPRQPVHSSIVAFSPDNHILDRLEELGYGVGRSLETADLVVATSADEAIASYVRRGGRLLLIPEGECALHPFFPHWQAVKVRERKETAWAGEWASSFAWLRRTGVFAGIPGGSLLDETFDAVLPKHVITGCNLHDFHHRVHAGLVVGWIHKAVALVAERSYGEGHFVASTFRVFDKAAAGDPTAVMLLDALIALALKVSGATTDLQSPPLSQSLSGVGAH